jgi:chromosome segregation ATPase
MKKVKRIAQLEEELKQLEAEIKESENLQGQADVQIANLELKKEEFEARIESFEQQVAEFEEEQEVYKFFINSLQKIEHQKDERKKLLIETIGLDRPYTISNSEILKAVESWLK